MSTQAPPFQIYKYAAGPMWAAFEKMHKWASRIYFLNE